MKPPVFRTSVKRTPLESGQFFIFRADSPKVFLLVDISLQELVFNDGK